MDMILHTKLKDDIIWIKHIGDSAAIGREFEKLLELGCVPTMLRGQIMRYDYQKVLDSRLYRLCLKKVNTMTNILPLSKVPADCVEAFAYDYPAQKVIINSSRIDRDISMAIMDPNFGDAIDGILYACSYDQCDVFAPLVFMRDQAMYTKTVPILMTFCIARAGRLYGRGENIILEPAFPFMVNGYRETLGEPEESYSFCEYFTLGRREMSDPVIAEIERYNRADAVKEDGELLRRYLALEEMRWISLASIRSMRYIGYSDTEFNSVKMKYRENLKIKAEEWGLDIDKINQIIDDTTEDFFGTKY